MQECIENVEMDLPSTVKVFKEELLREKILQYVIHTSTGSQPSPDYIEDCRLVQKPWLKTISKVLHNRRTPLFFLHLDKNNSLEGSAFVQENGKLLQQFLNHVLDEIRLDDRVPPFSLKVDLDFFLEENYPNFLRCLRFCRGSLIELDITFPLNGGSMPLLLPILTFHVLRKLTVTFSAGKIRNKEKGMIKPANAGNNAIASHFIQSIFNGCVELEEFCVPYVTGVNLLPFGFEYLILTTTITSLKLFCEMKNKHLELLLKSNLPKLKILNIVIPFSKVKKDTIFKILDKFRKTLQSVGIEGISHDGIPKDTNKFKFPLMTKLEKLDDSSTHCELESESIQQNLPNLNHLVLEDKLVHMFQKWVKDSIFVKVNFLRASIVNDNYSFEHRKFDVNFNEGLMQSLCKAFPNLHTLQITLCGTNMRGLQLLFQEMKDLQVLSIILKRSERIVNSDFWDALLIGVPIEWATALRTTPAFWGSLELKDNGLPSIKKLNKLRELHLRTEDAIPMNGSLVSDTVFYFALIEMPALKALRFRGRFTVSSVMAHEWKKMGRKLYT